MILSFIIFIGLDIICVKKGCLIQAAFFELEKYKGFGRRFRVVGGLFVI